MILRESGNFKLDLDSIVFDEDEMAKNIFS